MNNNKMCLLDHLSDVMKDERMNVSASLGLSQMARGEAIVRFASKFATEASRMIKDQNLTQTVELTVDSLTKLIPVAERLVKTLRANCLFSTDETDGYLFAIAPYTVKTRRTPL